MNQDISKDIKQTSKILATNEILPYSFTVLNDISIQNEPIYSVPTVIPATYFKSAILKTGKESNPVTEDLIDEFLYNIIENKEFSADFPATFDCVLKKTNYEILYNTLNSYKSKLDEIRKHHISLDDKIRSLMATNTNNLKYINDKTSEIESNK